ncbi:endonuclease III [Candidatus Micrarchaeota archaeon RBG_16_36_9]|nr:MAG: endonuclease III [Candidatus Micrarchaeota archaeon RBG_16_36_9]
MSNTLKVIELLKKNYPNAKYYLNFSNPLELMVAAILSAQVRDEIVNATTPKIFARYKTAKDYANVDLKEFTREISAVTFAGMKSKNIINACKILVEKNNGKVPDTMDELIDLPGIGRKTANTILINAFGKIEGIPVDTHVIRISFRLGWTKNKKPEEIEHDLMKIVPKEDWKKIAYLMKAHGRAICKTPIPFCSKCFLNDLCLKQGVTKKM